MAPPVVKNELDTSAIVSPQDWQRARPVLTVAADLEEKDRTRLIEMHFPTEPTLRDELLSLRADATAKSISAHALLFEEFLVREAEAGRLRLPLGPVFGKALVHGHCHQKSFGAFKSVEQALRLVPDLHVETIESSCCGMAGAFGYGADTYQASMDMAELSLLPAIRRADAAALIVADGTSCRHQIKDGAQRGALHVARVLAMSLDNARSNP